ncbi:NAD(P)H-dependent oxidoreductase [Gemmobacter lanyuensis]
MAATARAALEVILSADALVVASPVYKGSYTGLFKHLIDLIDPAALQGKPVLLAATGGGDRHALVIEHQLRPLFGFFEAQTLPTGVYAADRDFAGVSPRHRRCSIVWAGPLTSYRLSLRAASRPARLS